MTTRNMDPRRNTLAVLALFICAAAFAPPKTVCAANSPEYRANAREVAFLDSLEYRTFRWFWDLSDTQTGRTPDRAPTKSFVSVAATGFGLTGYPIGVERGWISRELAAERVRNTLRFFWEAPQDTTRHGAAGYKGFFYHFLDSETGLRFADVELSTLDTALLTAGALCCQTYFDRPEEQEIRALADSLFGRVDWQWLLVRPPVICHGWGPEDGFLPYDYRGYNEAMIMHILALASPTHPVSYATWEAWISGYRWGTFEGLEHVGFPPLFGHQYSHCWIDFRGIQDDYMRDAGLDYFENSRRATLSQRAYAKRNPDGWEGYGAYGWGMTACDGPFHGTLEIGGRERAFRTYWARGAGFAEVQDDGTLSPAAVAGSIPFAPEIVIPTLVHIRDTYGANVYGQYGFVDAYNPTLKADVKLQHGRIDPKQGWFDTDCLGIDQGPILIMIENWRSGLVWDLMRRNPHIVRGLRAAGFSGGWLDAAPSASPR